MDQDFVRMESVALQYQPLVPSAPVDVNQMRQRAVSNDDSTVSHWHKTWIRNIKKNKETYGSFTENSIAKLWRMHEYRPAIIAGSGPSLKYNAKHMKDRRGLTLVSCLHNLHLFEELDLEPDYYVTLDAGPITVKEVTEGGCNPDEWYWERSKDRKLVAYIGTDPLLLEKWQGDIYFFNAATPDPKLNDEIEDVEKFRHYISSGGNVLGGCLYLAKAIFGSRTIIYTGADFSFGYPDMEGDDPKHRFHSWKSSYDKDMGRTMRVTDVFGNKVHTWPSYYNFKSFFDWAAKAIPGEYINASEGGCLGAYDNGNLADFKYMSLKDAIAQVTMHNELEESMTKSVEEYELRKILY